MSDNIQDIGNDVKYDILFNNSYKFHEYCGLCGKNSKSQILKSKQCKNTKL
jgi:hypothetical protein